MAGDRHTIFNRGQEWIDVDPSHVASVPTLEEAKSQKIDVAIGSLVDAIEAVSNETCRPHRANNAEPSTAAQTGASRKDVG